jgi:hypothetical protein
MTRRIRTWLLRLLCLALLGVAAMAVYAPIWMGDAPPPGPPPFTNLRGHQIEVHQFPTDPARRLSP